jgi:hypothetical protein
MGILSWGEEMALDYFGADAIRDTRSFSKIQLSVQ